MSGILGFYHLSKGDPNIDTKYGVVYSSQETIMRSTAFAAVGFIILVCCLYGRYRQRKSSDITKCEKPE
jgi:hypothetical protein